MTDQVGRMAHAAQYSAGRVWVGQGVGERRGPDAQDQRLKPACLLNTRLWGSNSGDPEFSQSRKTGWRWCQSNANQSPIFAYEQGRASICAAKVDCLSRPLQHTSFGRVVQFASALFPDDAAPTSILLFATRGRLFVIQKVFEEHRRVVSAVHGRTNGPENRQTRR